MHQRERGHLPALRPAARIPHFSKSAPNLDKSRTSSATLTASASRNDILGKSYEGLNAIINNNNDIDKLNLDLDDRSTNQEHDDYDDDDDDDVEVKGCFGFIRSDDSFIRHKKSSLDSKISENVRIINGDLRYRNRRPANYDPPSTKTQISLDLKCNQNLDDVPYDRVFYRAIQKSLDDIFSRDDFTQQFVTSQNARNSKSSGDLTAATFNEGEEDIYGTYRFQRYGSESKFDRDCFFSQKNDESIEPSENDASIASSNSFNDHSYHNHRKPIDNSLDDSFASLNLSTENSKLIFDERKNSMCSDHSSIDMQITTRKSSVTFRNSVDITLSPNEDDQPYSFFNNGAVVEESASDMRTHFFQTQAPHQSSQSKVELFATGINHLNVEGESILGGSSNSSLKSALRNMKKEKKEKPRLLKYKSGLSRLFKFAKTKPTASVSHSNSFYSKFENANDLNEALISIDDHASSQSLTAQQSDEPHYDAIFTTNFVLAKKKKDHTLVRFQ